MKLLEVKKEIEAILKNHPGEVVTANDVESIIVTPVGLIIGYRKEMSDAKPEKKKPQPAKKSIAKPADKSPAKKPSPTVASGAKKTAPAKAPCKRPAPKMKTFVGENGKKVIVPQGGSGTQKKK